MFSPHLNYASALWHLVKLKIRVFVKILMLESKTQEILVIDFYFTYSKRCSFL